MWAGRGPVGMWRHLETADLADERIVVYLSELVSALWWRGVDIVHDISFQPYSKLWKPVGKRKNPCWSVCLTFEQTVIYLSLRVETERPWLLLFYPIQARFRVPWCLVGQSCCPILMGPAASALSVKKTAGKIFR